MSTRSSAISSVALLALSTLGIGSGSGCAYGEMTQVLRAQVATETDCSSIMVRKASAYTPGFQGNQYIVTGCGVERFYTCKGEEGLADYGNKDCTFVNGPPGAKPKDAAPAPAPGGGDLGGPSPDSEGMDDDMDNG